MTEQTNKAIQEAAEAKYPRYPQGHASPQDINFAKKQKAFIAGATLYAEQLEEARKECERLREGIKETIDWLQLHRPTMGGTLGPISILKQILNNNL